MIVLVIGSALREVSDVQERLGMTFLEAASTAPKYRLYSLEARWAALVEDHEAGTSVAGELVEIPDELWGEVVASEPPGITPGPVELADGRTVLAALGDQAHLREHGVEITEFGSFLAYLRARR